MDNIYTMEYYYSVIRKIKNEIMPFAATWMQLQRKVLSEVSQKERQIPPDAIQNPIYDTNEPIYETEKRLTDRTDWEPLTGWGKVEREARASRRKRSQRGWTNCKEAAGSYDKPQWKRYFKKNVYMFITESFCYKAVINILNLYFNLKNKAKKESETSPGNFESGD